MFDDDDDDYYIGAQCHAKEGTPQLCVTDDVDIAAFEIENSGVA